MSAGEQSAQPQPGLTRGADSRSADVRLHRLAVLFTDMAGSTQFAQKHGSLAAVRKRWQHNELLCPLVDRHGGTLINIIGDALLAVFDDTVAAARCAVAMQRRCAAEGRFGPDGDDRDIHIRVGIHFGETAVWRENGRTEVGGQAVNVAARVEAACGKKTDQIVVSDAAARRLESDPELATEPVGTVPAKGLGDLTLHRVVWDRPDRGLGRRHPGTARRDDATAQCETSPARGNTLAAPPNAMTIGRHANSVRSGRRSRERGTATAPSLAKRAHGWQESSFSAESAITRSVRSQGRAARRVAEHHVRTDPPLAPAPGDRNWRASDVVPARGRCPDHDTRAWNADTADRRSRAP